MPHCGTLKMSKAPQKTLVVLGPIFFCINHLVWVHGAWRWEIVQKVVPVNVPSLQDPQQELLDVTKLGPFWI